MILQPGHGGRPTIIMIMKIKQADLHTVVMPPLRQILAWQGIAPTLSRRKVEKPSAGPKVPRRAGGAHAPGELLDSALRCWQRP